ncbi:Bro-N domain-containing protein [Methylobacterium komagatae]|uniref:Bro-N domain-containing protein n=1 Tax=Methylobacterium komagatae TaxID=374425 RepID=A0ABW2BED0_9HYPH
MKTTKTNTFSFAGLELRSITIEGKPWFSAADVCEFLGLTRKNATVHIRKLDDAEKGVYPFHTVRGPQKSAVISESGLYTLTMRSDKPQAKEFQNWVTGTVLPAIRKDGMYVQGEEKLDPNNDAWTGSTNPLLALQKEPLTAN